MPMKKYTKKLYDFLEKYRVQRGNKMSHYSMSKPVGCFYISGNSKRDRLKCTDIIYIDICIDIIGVDFRSSK